MSIQYKEIDAAIEEALVAQYGGWVRDYNCLARGKGCYLVAAMDRDTVAGFAAIHPQQWIAPLDDCSDGFIEVIEVAKEYRRQGIGRHLVKLLEEFAKSYGYHQIRAWSSDDKVEALRMWYKLKYCMCPVAMLGEMLVCRRVANQHQRQAALLFQLFLTYKCHIERMLSWILN